MKILSHVDKVSQAVESRIEAAFNPIAMMAMGNPQMMTYYSTNIEKSVLDPGFTDVGDPVGVNSEVVYNRIRNMMAVGFGDLTIDDAFLDEIGSTLEYNGTCNLYVDTIRPQSGDLFTLNIIPRPFIFIVTGTKTLAAINEPVYTISFILKYTSQEKYDQLQSQVDKTYVMTAHKFGASDSFVIEEEKYYDNKKYIDDAISIINLYKMLFFDEQYSSFKYGFGDNYYIDWVLHMFLYLNRLIVMDEIQVHANGAYHQNNDLIFIERPLAFDQYVYEKSFFGRYLSGKLDKEVLINPHVTDMPSQNQRHIGKSNKIILGYMETLQEDTVPPYFTETFINAIKNGALYPEGTPNRSILNLIVSFYKGTATKAMLDTLEISDDQSLDNFYLLPLVVYIYRKLIMG